MYTRKVIVYTHKIFIEYTKTSCTQKTLSCTQKSLSCTKNTPLSCTKHVVYPKNIIVYTKKHYRVQKHRVHKKQTLSSTHVIVIEYASSTHIILHTFTWLMDPKLEFSLTLLSPISPPRPSRPCISAMFGDRGSISLSIIHVYGR